MTRRRARIVHRLMLLFAAMPLLQVACGSDFAASALSAGITSELAIRLDTSLETVFLNLFGA